MGIFRRWTEILVKRDSLERIIDLLDAIHIPAKIGRNADTDLYKDYISLKIKTNLDDLSFLNYKITNRNLNDKIIFKQVNIEMIDY